MIRQLRAYFSAPEAQAEMLRTGERSVVQTPHAAYRWHIRLRDKKRPPKGESK